MVANIIFSVAVCVAEIVTESIIITRESDNNGQPGVNLLSWKIYKEIETITNVKFCDDDCSAVGLRHYGTKILKL